MTYFYYFLIFAQTSVSMAKVTEMQFYVTHTHTWKSLDWQSGFPALPPVAAEPLSAHRAAAQPWLHRWSRRGSCTTLAARQCKGTNPKLLLCGVHTPGRHRGPAEGRFGVSSWKGEMSSTKKRFGFLKRLLGCVPFDKRPQVAVEDSWGCEETRLRQRNEHLARLIDYNRDWSENHRTPSLELFKIIKN